MAGLGVRGGGASYPVRVRTDQRGKGTDENQSHGYSAQEKARGSQARTAARVPRASMA